MGAHVTDTELIDMKEALEYISEATADRLGIKFLELAEVLRPAQPTTERPADRWTGRTELWQVGQRAGRLVLPRQLDRKTATILTSNASFLISDRPFAFNSDGTSHGEGFLTQIGVPLVIGARCEIYAQPLLSNLAAVATMAISTEHIDPMPDPGAIHDELEHPAAPQHNSDSWC